MKPKATTSKKTIKIVNAFDKRDLYIQAILNGRLNGLIKLDYPFSNALLTNVIYTDVNHLFKFALEVGKLEVTYIKKDIQKVARL